ncbi:hypothetical protein LSCM4_05821 [Leishmania orientalis]|uniref:C-CAP/cofactor C-like domain-containing protein n=1 Tax=Leishmania orientalis TaxID=2249476 RepID=A0A836KVN5_9TRYP|nr:hypothetical protein LSCM4_05821 [Leishmania orientalis]
MPAESATPTQPWPLPRREEAIPHVGEVQVVFQEFLQRGASLVIPRVAVAQNALHEVLQEHTRLLNYMETHGRPKADAVLIATEGDGDGESEPTCVYTFRIVYDGAITIVQDGVVAAMQQRAAGDPSRSDAPLQAPSSLSLIENALQCIAVLIESLGWVLHRPSAFAGGAKSYLASRQLLLDLFSTHAMSACKPGLAALPPSSTSPATSSTAAANRATVLAAWLHQAHMALSTLSHFVSGTYPHGPWFAHRNRRSIVRSRHLRPPSDVGEAPFEMLVRAASRVQNADVTALSTAVLSVAQAHTKCLSVVRATRERPRDRSNLANIFAALNTSLNELTGTCEDVIRRRDDYRPHAHAVLEAGSVFTWLTTDLEPCVVIEEAFGSANTYINKITARGNVLLQQRESDFAVQHPGLAKANVRWAAMLRDALQRMVLMVMYRYPRVVPWGESLESPMPRYTGEPRPPFAPRDHGEVAPVWRRAQLASERVMRQQAHPPSPATSSMAGAEPPTPSVGEALTPPPATTPAPPVLRSHDALVLIGMEPSASSLPLPPPSPSPPSSTAPKRAELPLAESLQSKPTPKCTFDPITQTWVVQHYYQSLVDAASGTVEPVLVTLPGEKLDSSHLVRILDCFNTFVTIPVRVRGVAVERCRHSKLQMAGSSGPVRISDTERQEMLIETSSPLVYAAKVRGLMIHLGEGRDTEIATSMASNVNVTVTVNMPDGEQEVRELALPEQYISIIKEMDQLVTSEVTYSG